LRRPPKMQSTRAGAGHSAAMDQLISAQAARKLCLNRVLGTKKERSIKEERSISDDFLASLCLNGSLGPRWLQLILPEANLSVHERACLTDVVSVRIRTRGAISL